MRHRGPNVTPEEKEAAISWVRAGLSAAKVARAFGKTVASVAGWAADEINPEASCPGCGSPVRSYRHRTFCAWCRKRVSALIRRWIDGGEIDGQEMAEVLGLNRDAFYSRVKRLKEARQCSAATAR